MDKGGAGAVDEENYEGVLAENAFLKIIDFIN